MEDEPVAICRLKRVAADLRGDIEHLLPTAPIEKNGKASRYKSPLDQWFWARRQNNKTRYYGS